MLSLAGRCLNVMGISPSGDQEFGMQSGSTAALSSTTTNPLTLATVMDGKSALFPSFGLMPVQSPFRFGPTSLPGRLPVKSSATATRDADYYFPDGNCVIRAGDTLFNVRRDTHVTLLPSHNVAQIHRSIFTRDDSIFIDMFSLPQDSSIALEGSSDSNPVLVGDTDTEFRALCWALYSLCVASKLSSDLRHTNVPLYRF